MRMSAILLICCLLAAATPAEAHRIYISAWVEGDRMCSESMFSSKSRPKNSRVTVRDAAGQVLHEGQTDAMGVACFPLPKQPVELFFVVDAGQGHRAETSLLPEDIADALPMPEATRPAEQTGEQPGENSGSAAADTASAGAAPATGAALPAPAARGDGADSTAPVVAPLGQEALARVVREAVRAELQKQLGPVRQSLAALQSGEPGLLEIFGGIGWIAGLAGVAMMVANRRRKD